MFKLAYQTLLERNKVNETELPAETQKAIADVNAAFKAVESAQEEGLNVSQPLAKLKRLDQWVCSDILDHVNDTDKNTAPPPVTAAEIKNDVQAIEQEAKIDPEALTIEQELKKAYEAKEVEVNFEQLRKIAPKTYQKVFDGYEPDQPNGLRTDLYECIEIQPNSEKFKINKR